MGAIPERRKRKRIIGIVVVVALAMAGALFALTKSKIESLECANTLASLGVAARIYAQDNGGTYALDLRNMSNEISSPKILMCPSEKLKKPALHFFDVCTSNTTYEYLVAGMKQDNRGTNAVFRCPIHWHTVREDGFVVRGDGTIQHGKIESGTLR